MESSKLRVIFLVGVDNPAIRRSVEAVCRLDGVEPLGVILDHEVVSFSRRLQRLFRRTRGNGWRYPVFKVLEAIAAATTTLVNTAAVSQTEVNRVLREAFPERCFSMEDIGKRYGMRIHAVGSLNDAKATCVLKESGADLGVALATGALHDGALAIPRLGTLTLQEGTLCEAEEVPSGFWELFEQESSAEVRAGFVRLGARIGDVLARSAVAIQESDTPDSLAEKLNEEGSRILASAVALIRDREAVPLRKESVDNRPRPEPTRREVILLRKRLPHWRSMGAGSTIVRNLYVLFVYYSGLYFLTRQWHRLYRSRAAIVLYHRVNDYSKDVLTVDCRTFAAQLLAMSRHYYFMSSAEMVDRIRSGKPLRPTTMTIHFDDCYRDILLNGAPIMRACGVPACAFINSGFIDTNRTFGHDVESPFEFEMLRSGDVQTWVDMGFEVGAHTINHVDLGKCPVEEAGPEIVECGFELQKITGKPVDLFAFPFGRPHHIRAATLEIIQTGNYIANFSANGGFIDAETDPYDIPRGGAHYESSAVYCLLQIEGLTLSRLAKRFRDAWNRPAQAVVQP